MLEVSGNCECWGWKAPSSLPGPNKRKVDHVIPVSMKTTVSSIHFGKFLVSGPACALLYVSWFSDAVRQMAAFTSRCTLESPAERPKTGPESRNSDFENPQWVEESAFLKNYCYFKL